MEKNEIVKQNLEEKVDNNLDDNNTNNSDNKKGKVKKVFKTILNFVVVSMNGMAFGLFGTLIIGTIINLLVKIPGLEFIGPVFTTLKSLCYMGIGAGVAWALKLDGIKLISVAACGGLALISEDILVAYFLAITGSLLCKYLFVKKTPVDIIIIPLTCILITFLLQSVISTPIKYVMNGLETFIKNASLKAPFLMGIIISVVMGMALTAPISSAAIAIAISLSGIAGGAAVVGCCTQMLGFAVMSRKDNNLGMVVSVGVGTSMLQFKNILKKPIIWLPTIIVSAILGPLSTLVFKLECSKIGSGMGTSGLVGVIETITEMLSKNLENNTLWIIGVILLEIVLPIVLVYGLDVLFRKLGLIKKGDLKI